VVITGDAASGLDLAGSVLAVTTSATSAEVRYVTDDNSIYSITTGAKTWTGSFPASLGGFNRDEDPRRGSVAGRYVVYASGHEVIGEPY
jgi:hypothetical protein